MERCPSCRARWDGNATCRRCGMDLASLIAVEQAAERLTRRGANHLAADDPEAAVRDLSQALGLQRTPFAKLLLELAEKLTVDKRSAANAWTGHAAKAHSRERAPGDGHPGHQAKQDSAAQLSGPGLDGTKEPGASLFSR